LGFSGEVVKSARCAHKFFCFFYFSCMTSPKKRMIFLVLLFAYRFLSIGTSANPAIAIAVIMPIVAGKKYVSAIDGAGGVGVGVACGASATPM
jgi:hypothetical protein